MFDSDGNYEGFILDDGDLKEEGEVERAPVMDEAEWRSIIERASQKRMSDSTDGKSEEWIKGYASAIVDSISGEGVLYGLEYSIENGDKMEYSNIMGLWLSREKAEAAAEACRQRIIEPEEKWVKLSYSVTPLFLNPHFLTMLGEVDEDGEPVVITIVYEDGTWRDMP